MWFLNGYVHVFLDLIFKKYFQGINGTINVYSPMVLLTRKVNIGTFKIIRSFFDVVVVFFKLIIYLFYLSGISKCYLAS